VSGAAWTLSLAVFVASKIVAAGRFGDWASALATGTVVIVAEIGTAGVISERIRRAPAWHASGWTLLAVCTALVLVPFNLAAGFAGAGG
jgi:hypothetical protein